MQQIHCPNNYINKASCQQKIFTSQNVYPSFYFVISQKIVNKHHSQLITWTSSKHHGIWSVSPTPVATSNYLWQWEHRNLRWIGLAKIPKLETLEIVQTVENTWKHSCIMELSTTFSKCKKACIHMFTWK